MKYVFNWLLLICLTMRMLPALSAGPKVTLKEDAETYTIDNGLVQVRVSKVTGDLVSCPKFEKI